MFLVGGVWADFRKRAAHILFVGLLNSGIPFALFAYAVMHISTGLTSILNATVPLTGALVAWVWLKDRPDSWRATGLAIGFVGVCLLVIGKSGFSLAPGAASAGTALVAMLTCLMATLCYGLAASFTKRHLTGIHPLATASGSQIGAALGLALPTWWLWPGATDQCKCLGRDGGGGAAVHFAGLHPVLSHHCSGRPEQGVDPSPSWCRCSRCSTAVCS